jgi:hypothetical protein
MQAAAAYLIAAMKANGNFSISYCTILPLFDPIVLQLLP